MEVEARTFHSAPWARPFRLPSRDEFAGGVWACLRGPVRSSWWSDGCEVALEVAIASGVGLIGEGALPGLQAFVVTHWDWARPGPVMFVVSRSDVVELFELGTEETAPRMSQLPPLPFGLMVTEALDDAVNVLESEALLRALVRLTLDEIRWTPTLVLITLRPRHELTRLQAVLDLGSGYGVAAMLWGNWRAGSTVMVRTDGQVCAPRHGPGRVMHDV